MKYGLKEIKYAIAAKVLVAKARDSVVFAAALALE